MLLYICVMERKNIYSGDYISLFNDWEILISDWVWCVWSMDKNETYNLYLALFEFYNTNHL